MDNSCVVSDLANLYKLIYAQATLQFLLISHGKEGFYLGILGEFDFHDATLAIGRPMIQHHLGTGTSDSEPTTFAHEKMNRYYGGSYAMGTNSRGVSKRAKSIGWVPK
ncbi:hypothetical protein I302_103979 [Kwoniella bestiolae CBS 10118]|uniref:Uncharacterized protein n=1 Tax=Kwoniella bestiolae CBS 10118 TaxID=1296100 RepID=A0A1B9G9Z1_9TREE|nr:hypothetical protein I302_02685 [Kwoniella bestiolae CBS 10118]OCF27836.1 hypothetical protein I302_02685 [Kwoniella bestiolae CBS 10118]